MTGKEAQAMKAASMAQLEILRHSMSFGDGVPVPLDLVIDVVEESRWEWGLDHVSLSDMLHDPRAAINARDRYLSRHGLLPTRGATSQDGSGCAVQAG